MKTIKVKKDVVIALTDLCGKIQRIKNTRISASASIGLLLRFMEKNQTAFWHYLKDQRAFEENYEDKIKTMQKNGIPTTRDLAQGKRCDSFHTNNSDGGRSEMPLADNALLLTPYGKGCIFLWSEQ